MFLKATAELKQKLKSATTDANNKPIKPQIALDIDNTISATTREYFKASVEKFGYPSGTEPHEQNLDAIEAKHQYTFNVDEWRNSDSRQEFYDSLLVSPDLHRDVELIPEAGEAVPRLAPHVDVGCYLTARPDVLYDVTLEWLGKHGFPEAPLIMAPSYSDHYKLNSWKAEILDFLFPEVMGIVDDNPSLPKNIAADYPEYEGVVFHYGEHNYDDLSITVESCASWEHVLERVEATVQAS